MRICGIAFSSYAVRCIRNEILLEIRKNGSYSRKSNENVVYLYDPIPGVEDETFADTLSDDFDMEIYIMEKDETERLYKAISKLKTNEQLVIRYYYFLGMPQRKIAKIVGLHKNSVSRLISDARKKLRTYIIDDEFYIL